MKNIIKYVIRYPIWADLIVLLIASVGFLCFQRLNVNFFPEVEQRNVSVQVVFPGASPQEMEDGVVLKIEDALKGLEGIEQITSVSAENMATIITCLIFT